MTFKILVENARDEYEICLLERKHMLRIKREQTLDLQQPILRKNVSNMEGMYMSEKTVQIKVIIKMELEIQQLVTYV